MPTPRKEDFIAQQLDRMGPVFAMGVGGSFDVWSGLYKRAPEWMQRAGLEWFYRVVKEPRARWHRYFVQQPPALFQIVRQRLGLYRDPFAGATALDPGSTP